MIGKVLLIMIFSGLISLSSFIFYYFPISYSSDNGIKIVEPANAIIYNEPVIYGLPIKIAIPKINVSSSIEYTGFTSDGAMGIPTNPINVAWFELGARPGEIGSAVMDGHLDKKNGKPAVFYNLYKLRKGDKIFITDKNNQIITFVVRESRKYGYKADASGVFVSNDGKSYLNLITCGGSWNKKAKIYSQRLIVFADRE